LLNPKESLSAFQLVSTALRALSAFQLMVFDMSFSFVNGLAPGSEPENPARRATSNQEADKARSAVLTSEAR
jgi:hypothetical protein